MIRVLRRLAVWRMWTDRNDASDDTCHCSALAVFTPANHGCSPMCAECKFSMHPSCECSAEVMRP